MGRINRTCKDRNVYIRGKEPGGSEVPEHREAIDNDKESGPEYTPHGQIWLQIARIYEGLAVDSLDLQTIVCGFDSYQYRSSQAQRKS